MLRRGTVLQGRYTLTERIGGGAMGEVWRAEDGVLKRQVAVKVLRPELLNDTTFLARFRREAEVLATLNHPNIVSIHDYGENSGDEGDADGESGAGRVAYLVMDLIDGRSFDQLSPPATEVLGLLAQALDGLHAAHQREIVHRDIKPSNLMLREDGRVTVTDFGIARAAAGTKLTEDRSVIGTAEYMAPERAAGRGAIPASDLYAVGVVCYELLTGALPFTGESAVEVMFQHIRQPVPELPDRFPEPVRDFVTRALAKRPEDRFADAAAMAAAARRAAAGLPLEEGEGSEESEESEEPPAPAVAPPPVPAPEAEPKAAAQAGPERETEPEPRRRPKWERWQRHIPVVLAAALMIALSTVTLVYLYPDPDKGRSTSPDAHQLPATGGASPAGQHPPTTLPDDDTSPKETDPGASPSENGQRDQDGDGDQGGQEPGNGGASSGADGGGGQTSTSGSGGTSGDASGGGSSGGDGSAGGSSGGSGSASGGGGSGGGGSGGGGSDPADGCGGGRWGQITNVGSGLSLGLPGDTPKDGQEVILGGNTSHGWVNVTATGSDSSQLIQFMVCREGGLALSNSNFGGPWAAPVTLSGQSSFNVWASWSLIAADNGAFQVQTMSAGCLTANGAGNPVTVAECSSGSPSQLWRVPR